jgi:hypothetical protein
VPAHAVCDCVRVHDVQHGEDGGEPLRDGLPGAVGRLPIRHQLIRTPFLGGYSQYAR